MHKSLHSMLLAALLVNSAGLISVSAAEAPSKTADSSAHNGFNLPPLPADAHVTQSVTVDGRSLKYTATVGSLPVRESYCQIWCMRLRRRPLLVDRLLALHP